MSEFDDEEDAIASDFHSIVGNAQFNEMVEVEKQREKERQQAKELAEQQRNSSMTLLQIAGLKSQKELDKISADKNAAEIRRLDDDERKRKEKEHAQREEHFPVPDLD